MNLEWDRLKIFYYVAKEKSITRAAQHLCMLQPSVTRNIQQLEHQAKSKLLIRHPRGLILTKQGEILFEHVSNMMTELELANNKISGTAEDVSGTLKVTTTHAYASTVLFPHICNFQKLYPDIKIHLICNDTDLDLITREADAAIRPYDANTTELEQVFLHERKFQLFASKNYLDQMGIPFALEDLDQHKLIAYYPPYPSIQNPQNVQWVLTLGMPSDQRREPFMIVNSAECMAQAAEAGLGIIALSNDSLLIEKYNLTRVLPDIEAPLIKGIMFTQNRFQT
ncbi:HTH-type transcriptional regulator CysL [Caedimonas varicaedens]|uniref:HTH-type transcriptional regulator CysL n=1 Tax=Caedimonas varicaedens TaxID=1629334 RepID=A0A0K8MCC0_9PROT|nr:HTH-type transcriptional regulator CysL [Caedimonas varicaedens]